MSTSEPLRVLIVDDEVAARRRLTHLLAAHRDVIVVGEARDVPTATRAVETLCPTLVLLDVQMPGPSGLALFERVAMTMNVVFVTAFDDYAVRAFDVNALDYLLKPLSAERLARALERVRRAEGRPVCATELRPEDIVSVPDQRGLRLVQLGEITHIVARDDYSEVHLASGESLLDPTSMAAWEARLPGCFVRVHRSFIVDTRRLVTLSRGLGSYSLRLRGVDGTIPVARSRLDGLRAQLT